MKRRIEFIYPIFFAMTLFSCGGESENGRHTDDQKKETIQSEEDTLIKQDDSIEGHTSAFFTPGHYERKGIYGTNNLRIDSISPDKCRFVFGWGKASCYTKLAGNLTVDENGKGTFKMSGCEALDFTFKKDYVSLKEYKCNFHGKECPFDGMFKLKTGPSYTSLNSMTMLEEIEDGSKKFEFYASFTEPFWNVYIWRDIVVFNHLDGPPDLYETNRLFDPEAEEQTIYFQNEEREWKMVIKKKPGSDGMSNITYPYSVVLGDNFHGGGGKEYQKEDSY